MRLGIRMQSDREGFSGQGNIYAGETAVHVTLYKSSTHLLNASMHITHIC